MTHQNLRLVADVGGTNTRIALYRPASDEYLHAQNYINRDFPYFEDVVDQWLASLPPTERPAECAIAIASPLTGDLVAMSNMDWSFSTNIFFIAGSSKYAIEDVLPATKIEKIPAIVETNIDAETR